MGGYVWRNKETDPYSHKRFLFADQQVPGSTLWPLPVKNTLLTGTKSHDLDPKKDM